MNTRQRRDQLGKFSRRFEKLARSAVLRLLSATVLLLGLSAPLLAQVCPPNLPPRVAPDSRYSLSEPVVGQVVVTDLQTGLQWKQCSEGQSGATCSSGSATLDNLTGALAAANASTFAGHNDWRLPSAIELYSLVESSCHSPSINTWAFPNTSIGPYWSSSTRANWEELGWAVSFFNGNLFSGGKASNGHFIRLVRGGEGLDAFDTNGDFTPDAFSFAAQTDVPTSSVRTSDTITVAGITTATGIGVSGAADSQYRINGGAWTSVPGAVVNGDSVEVRHTSAATGATATSTTLTIGGVGADFVTTTLVLQALTIGDASVVEGNSGTTTLNFSVSLTMPALAGGVGFDIATADAVATAPADYTARTLTGQSIGEGQSSASFAVTVHGDMEIEPDEILRVLVSNVTGATLVDGEAIGTILTDDFRSLSINDSGKITCNDASATPTGTVSPATPDPEGAGFNEQDCTRGASAADALGVLYKQGGSSQAGRDYSKIANDGSDLPNSATLGSAPGDWACTRDNATGLVWEVKTDDGGLRDKDHSHTWYEPDANRNGGNAGSTGNDSCAGTLPGGLCNIQAYRTAVNALTGSGRLCGATDWRLPDVTELQSLMHYGVQTHEFAIDTQWFPNSISSSAISPFNAYYWSRDTVAKFPHNGWGVYFSASTSGGYVEGFVKTAARQVRLVRGGQ